MDCRQEGRACGETRTSWSEWELCDVVGSTGVIGCAAKINAPTIDTYTCMLQGTYLLRVGDIVGVSRQALYFSASAGLNMPYCSGAVPAHIGWSPASRPARM